MIDKEVSLRVEAMREDFGKFVKSLIDEKMNEVEEVREEMKFN